MSSFKPYSLELIKSFLEKVELNQSKSFDEFIAAKRLGIEPPEKRLAAGLTSEEISAVAMAVAAVVHAGVDLKKELAIRKRPIKKRSGTRLDGTIHSQEFGIVCAYVAKNISYTEAVNNIMSICHVEKRAAETFIKSRKSAAIETEKIRQRIQMATAAK